MCAHARGAGDEDRKLVMQAGQLKLLPNVLRSSVIVRPCATTLSSMPLSAVFQTGLVTSINYKKKSIKIYMPTVVVYTFAFECK